MKTIRFSTQFKKDFKRYRHRHRLVEKLFQVVRMLENEEPIPQPMRPHMLTGNYAGCMECHIASDYPLYTSAYSPAASKHGQSLRMYGLSWQWPRMRACG